MRFRLLVISFIAILYNPPHLSAQTTTPASIPGDNILWAGTQIRSTIGDKWSWQVQPIFRYNNNLGDYQNASIDYSIRRKLSDRWHVQLLGRTWFMPDRRDRQFIWTDIAYKLPIPSLSLSMTNRLRYHLALDIDGNFDADFVRHIIQFVPTTSWKLKPTFGFETWYQFNGENGIRRIRIEPGLRYEINKQFGITTLWRRQNDINKDNERRDNLWVLALVVKL